MESLYKKIELKQPKFFQKLLKNEPEENAIAELNNILASRQIKEISLDDIENIVKAQLFEFLRMVNY